MQLRLLLERARCEGAWPDSRVKDEMITYLVLILSTLACRVIWSGQSYNTVLMT